MAGAPTATPAPVEPTRAGTVAAGPLPNVLVIVADDLGQDMVKGYGVHPRAPATPNLDALAADGVRFVNTVADPVCSPTRATLLTGRYAYRYGVGNAIPPKPGWALPETERLLPVALREGTGRYASVAVGKWHLASPDHGGYDHPRRLGFDHHVGTMGNLQGNVAGRPQTYFHWQRVEDGVPGVADGYITSATIDDALEAVTTTPEPWFVYVGMHAAHYPMHAPPAQLFHTPLPPGPTESDLYRAMVEAMDTEIGRLLAGLSPEVRARTDIVFLGDNGSAPTAVEPPWPKQQAKGRLTLGGVQVPLIVAGRDVPVKGGVSRALVNTTDLFATVLEWAGVAEKPPEDSLSFAACLRDPAAPGLRALAYAERFENGPDPAAWSWHEAMVRDDRYALVVENGEETGFFDLVTDPFQQSNLFDGNPSPALRASLRALRPGLPNAARIKRAGEPTADDDAG